MSSSRPTALVLAPLRGPGLDRLHEIAEVVYDPFIDHVPLKLHQEEELAARIAELGATIVISEGDKIAGTILDQPLVVIGSTRGDPTNVDVPAATAKGIPVIRAPGRNADAVAEITVALLFAVNRHIVAADHDVRAGDIYKDGSIPYQRFRAWEINGRTAGLVGLGAIGRALKWRLEGLGMTVLAYDPYADDAKHSLDEVLTQSDVISMHAPVTPETTKMIGAEQFAMMKDGAIYINAARAALHDTDALVEALKSGKLAGAGLDHFDHEWLDPKSELAQLPNVTLTPHIGGATYNTEANHARMVVEDIAAVLSGGTPVNCVNPEVLKKG
jgi:D-3-phosphoglycerate dehydrogenase / 2-oxoglutarate reductase